MTQVIKYLMQFKQWVLLLVIVNILNKGLLINNKKIKRTIQMFYYNSQHDMTSTITDVKFFQFKYNYEVEITTHRPGLMIGKAGRYIDELKEYINDGFFDMPVKIKLEECKIWFKLY